MKEATGELSMTVIVIIAVIAILTILSGFLLPRMKEYIGNTWNGMSEAADSAKDIDGMGGKGPVATPTG